ncbi:MAG: hypothetical protein KKH28_09690 [Elusimicrobia bacterium]|nr:hypothetical protein [Elusimicrobiota bacterium]
MKKLIWSIAVCAVSAGCAGPDAKSPAAAPSPPPSRQQAVVNETRIYVLGKVPDQDREQAFQRLLDSAQAQAAKKHAGDKPMEIGFSYSLTPKGAVYAFSEVEVSCLIQAYYAAGHGNELCADFFRIIDSRIKKITAQ